MAVNKCVKYLLFFFNLLFWVSTKDPRLPGAAQHVQVLQVLQVFQVLQVASLVRRFAFRDKSALSSWVGLRELTAQPPALLCLHSIYVL